MQEEDTIILRSYNKMNSIEKKMYSFQNLKFPIPINLYAAVYFIICFMIMWLIGRLLPFLNGIPPILKFVVLPYFISKYMRQKKLDGKKPWKYAIEYVAYMCIKNNTYERFKPVKKLKKIRFSNPSFKEF